MRLAIMPKRVAGGLVAGLLTVGFCATPLAPASASTPSSETKIIVKNADTYVNNIRDYFFCETSKCKKARSTEKKTAALDMAALTGEAKKVAKSLVPSLQEAIVRKFESDVHSLARAYAAYSKESSSEAVAKNTGLIYYQSANVGSDTYLLAVDVNGGTAAYVPWSVGAVAVLYALDVKSSTVPNDIYASQNLEEEATSLESDANGPSATFNALITKFAEIQKEVSADEILILQKKKTPIPRARISALSTELGVQFKEIVSLQNTLSK
jgi:hypothetical protein